MTAAPTEVPTGVPSGARTAAPTGARTAAPIGVPIEARTVVPTAVVTGVRTAVPTVVPTGAPTVVATGAPMVVRTVGPTGAPMVVRTAVPTVGPTAAPEQRQSAGGAVPGVGRPALRRCVDLAPDLFAGTVWGREAHLSPRESLPAPFDDLLSLEAADHLVSRQGLRTPFLRIAKDGVTLPASRFTRPGGVGATIGDQIGDDQLTRLFAGGATIVLQALHRTWSPLIDFAQQLTADLGHPVQVNAYLTPPDSQGFAAHYDVHDVFVLQVAGRKRWKIHRPVHPAPARDQPWTDHRQAVERAAAAPALLDAVLRPGDALYLPRGFLHSAQALAEISAHLTVGVHVWTRQHVLEQLLAELATDPELRASLPLGIDLTTTEGVGEEMGQTLDALRRALPRAQPAAVAARLRAVVEAAARAEPVGPVAQSLAAATADGGTRLRWRRHLPGCLDAGGDGDRAVVRTPEADVSLPGWAGPALTRLLAGEVLRVADLGGPTDAARVAVASTLLSEALVVVPDPAGEK